MRSIIKIEKAIRSNQLKKKVCDSCVERLKGVLTNEQIKKFKEAFYGTSEEYLFSERKG